MPLIHATMDTALRTADIRRACCAVEAIFRAGNILDELPPAALEEIRDYCTEWNKGREGTYSEFKAAWIKMVVEHLNDVRLRERRIFTGMLRAQDRQVPKIWRTTQGQARCVSAGGPGTGSTSRVWLRAAS
jgi:hypothetical protein